MDYQQRIHEARERMDRAESAAKHYTVKDPTDLAECARLLGEARIARNEFIETLDDLGIGVNEPTKGRFAADSATH